MTLNLKALSVATGVLFGGSFFVVGLLNLAFPSYGLTYLEVGESLYPGYRGPSGLGSVIVVTIYGLADGAIGGAIFAWLYNAVAGKAKASA